MATGKRGKAAWYGSYPMMRLRRHPVRAWAIGLALLAAAACGSGRDFAGPKPVALLAASQQSGAAFDAIRQAWSEGQAAPGNLRNLLVTFLRDYPHDSIVPTARVALALVALHEGDFATADAELSLIKGLPAGSTRDLATVARAMRLRMAGDSDSALALLRPLIGKSVDPLARSIFEEELTLTALATHRDYEAISYMDTWLRVTSEDEKASTVARVRALVEKLPKDVLVWALRAMLAQRTSFGYGIDIEHILSERLVHVAIETGDAELARLLLDTDPGGVALAGDAGLALGELATSRRGLNVVEGRTVGLLLPTESSGLRDEAASVLRGVMWALGLPRGIRRADLRLAAPPVRERPPAACGTLDAPASMDEAPLDEDVHLVTRDDAGSAGRTELSLDELAGQGAAVILAALDKRTAERALRWSEQHATPLISLVAPDEPPTSLSYGFVLGEPRKSVLEALARFAPALTTSLIVPVVDAGELAVQASREGGEGLAFSAPISCDIPAGRAGEARFPVGRGPRDRTRAWLVSGSSDCTAEVIDELTSEHTRELVVLSLEAAEFPLHTSQVRVVTAQAGIVPGTPDGDPREDEARRFVGTLGSLDWWAALGRDAATLARQAVQQLPADEATEPNAVSARRKAARDALADGHVRLWSSNALDFGPTNAMRRNVCAFDVPPR